MKKFQFAAGLFALAMLGACSNEIPEVPGTVEVEPGETGMYLTLNLTGGNLTRTASDSNELKDSKGNPLESDINTIQIIVYRGTRTYINEYFTASSTVPDDDGNDVKCIQNKTVHFLVDNTTYNEMETAANSTTPPSDWNILVYVNGPSKLDGYNDILTGATSLATWGIENVDGEAYNTRGFSMSNAAECKVTLNKPNATNGDGKKYSTSWNLTGAINLSRLATRFDYSESNKLSYTPLCQSNVSLAIDGMAIETFATNTYRIAQFSDDGTNASPLTHFTNGGNTSTLFRVTESYTPGEGNVDNPSSYESDVLHYCLNSSKKNVYYQPNTISKQTELSFNKVPYAAVKAQISLDYPTDLYADEDAKANSSFAKKESIFAVNGIIIGGARDLKAWKTSGKDFTITKGYSDADFAGMTETKKKEIKDAIDEQIAYVEKVVREYIQNHPFPENLEGQNRVTENNSIKTYLKAEEYKAKGNDEESKKYYTYYASYIRHMAAAEGLSNSWQFGVSRNTIYDLGVKYFKFLGNNGEGNPGSGPVESKVQDMNMQLTVEVNDWDFNTQNSAWEL